MTRPGQSPRANEEPASQRERLNRAHGIPIRYVGGRPGARPPAEEERLRSALQEHFRLVWRLLRRLGVAEGYAEDAAQQVFLTFAARLEEVAPGAERAFLIGLCPGVAANARRRSERDPTTPDGLEPPDANGLTPEELLLMKQRRATLDRALLSLPLEQRTVFVLFELEGFTLPEIARTLEVPLGTATSRLRRARLAFEQWVESRSDSDLGSREEQR